MRIAAAILTLGVLGAATPALAQYRAPPPYSGVLPPFEVFTIIRSMGFEPVSRPVLRGPVYVVQALDEVAVPVRVLVDARSGYVVRVVEARPHYPGRVYADIVPGDAAFGPRRAPPETVPPGVEYPPDVSLPPPAAQAPVPSRPKVAARTPLPRPAPPGRTVMATPAAGAAAVGGNPGETPDKSPDKSTGKSIPAPVASRSTPGDVAVTGSTGGSSPAAAPEQQPVHVPAVAPLE